MHLWPFFFVVLNFFKLVIYGGLRFFGVVFSLAKRLIWAIKINNRNELTIFHPKGGPF